MADNQIVITLPYTADLDRGPVEQYLPVAFGTGDKEAHKLVLTAYRATGIVDLTGAGVLCYVNRADKSTVVINGRVEDGKAVVLLPEECYVINGTVSIIIKLTMGNTRATVLWLTGSINRTSNGKLVDPGGVVPTLEELLAEIANMRTATAEATEAAAAAEAAREGIQGDLDALSEEIAGKLNNYRLSVNRLSTDGEQIGYALLETTGGTYSNEEYRVSGFCDVGSDNPYGKITVRGLTGGARICFYDAEKTFISVLTGSSVVQVGSLDLPENTKYVRVQSTSDLSAALVNVGESDKYSEPGRIPVIVPEKVSEIPNDAGYFSAQEKGKIHAEHVDFTLWSANLLDESLITQGYYVNHLNGALEANSSFQATGEYIDISGNAGTIVIFEYSADDLSPVGSFHRCAFYDEDKRFISGVSNGSGTGTDLATGIVPVPDGAAYVRCGWNKRDCKYLIAYGDSTDIPYEPRESIDANPAALHMAIKGVSARVPDGWAGRTWVSYGDSITALGNNGSANSYQYYVDKALGFGQSYRRGVGGQTYKANTYTFYANPDGSYAGRYGSGGLTEAPDGTTTHLGYFAAWDRITAMIPADIRESIDLVVLCGGTNDHGSVEYVETDGVITAGTPVWIANSAVDAEWAASELYAGGDYDITTFAGAVASTITKMRIWCPNAVIVLATPYPRWNTDTMTQYTNSKGLDFRAMCEIQIATAKYMGCPVVDANADCGIAAINFAGTVLDGIHPNATGCNLYGKAMADCLAAISPIAVDGR